MVERKNVINGTVKITKYVVTLYTDSQYLNPIKNQEFKPENGTAVDENGNAIRFDSYGNVIKTDRNGDPILDDEGNYIIDDSPIVYKQYIYCGLTSNRTYYYTIDVYKHLTYGAYGRVLIDRDFYVTSYGRFTVGRNGNVTLTEKTDWESEVCKGYSALVEWYFDRNELYESDSVTIGWKYNMNGEGWVSVPSHFISSVSGNAKIQHVAIEFESLFGDVEFKVMGIPLNEDDTVNTDYMPIEYNTSWADTYSANTGNTENTEESNG